MSAAVPTPSAGRAPALRQLAERYLQAQIDGDRAEAVRLVLEEGLGQGIPVLELYLGVVQAAQREIGRLWQHNQISVAQEHLATAISQLVVSQLYAHLERRPRTGRRVVVACVDGELHELGARMAADFLESAGFDVIYLGASVPVPSLVHLVRARRPDLLVLSAATSLCYPTLQRAIADVGEATGGALPILVGGAAFTMSDACPLPSHVVYAGRDALGLVAIAREVLGLEAAA